MKLKYSIIALLAAAFTFTGCLPEADHYLSELKVSSSYVSLPKTGGSAEITLNAVGAWEFEKIINTGKKDADKKDIYAIAPDWLTITPVSGEAGEFTVKFTADKPEERRETSLRIACSGKSQVINVVQEAEVAEKPELPITPIATVMAEGDGTYRVRGTVTKVVSTDYGNFYMVDESYNGPDFEIYGTKNAQGQYPKEAAGGWASFGIEAGDIVTVEGPYSLYKTTHELVDVTVIKIEKSLIEVADFDFKILPAIDTTFHLFVTSKVSPVLVTSEADWIKVVDLSESNGVLDFSIKASANPDLANRSADINIKAPGASKAVTVTQKAREATEADILEKHVDEVLAAEPANGPFYKVTGRIKEIVNATYGNFYLEDGTGEIYVYGLTATNLGIGASNDKSFGSLGLAQNDVVTVIGVRGRYANAKDPRQVEQLSSAYYVSHKGATVATVAEFLAAEVSTDKYYELTGTVSNIASDVYGNFDLTDATGKIYVYGLMNAPLYNLETGKFTNTKCFKDLGVTDGCTVTIRGFRAEYKGNAQVTDAFLVSVEAAGGMKIDGKFGDWAEITTGVTSEKETPVYAEFKVTNDSENIYFYSKRDNRDAIWNRGGYIYYDIDADNNPATGTSKEIDGLEMWLYFFPFDANQTIASDIGNGSGYPSADVFTNFKFAGAVASDFVEIEASMPLADAGIKSGDTIAVYSWSNKSGDDLKAKPIVYTVQ